MAKTSQNWLSKQGGSLSVIKIAARNLDLCGAAVFSAASYAAAGERALFWDYMEWKLLAVLFCLMAVTAGLRRSGFLEYLCGVGLRRCHSAGAVSFFFVGACFLSSMAVTNDAALLVFVPESIWILYRYGMKEKILVTVVWETIGANLGSMLLPIGNPQNLFLFFRYDLGLIPFVELTLPFAAASLALLWFLCRKQSGQAVVVNIAAVKVRRKPAAAWGILLLDALAAVLGVMPPGILLGLCLAAGFCLDRAVLWRVDYKLLILFCLLFAGVGNLQHIPGLRETAAGWIDGHELAAAVVLSQAVSNVPAAVLLAEYTDQAEALVIGTNLGGLGTLIASMASLISFRLYMKSPGAAPFRYIKVFTLWNMMFLLVLGSGAALYFS